MSTKFNAVIGIDPGASGAAVVLTPDRALGFITFRDKTKSEVASWIYRYSIRYDLFGTLELVHSIVGDDIVTANKFGRNTGNIEGYLVAHLIPYEEVPPQTWQREFCLGGKYKDQPARKRAHKAKAQELYPHVRVTFDLADALLIAEYGLRKLMGEITNGRNSNSEATRRQGRGILWEKILS